MTHVTHYVVYKDDQWEVAPCASEDVAAEFAAETAACSSAKYIEVVDKATYNNLFRGMLRAVDHYVHDEVYE